MSQYHIARQFQRKIRYNQQAIVDLPMRLFVALIIGTITLISIFGFISQSLVPPQYIHVSVDPLFSQWNESVNQSEYIISVHDSSNQKPIKNARVVFKGYSNIQYNQTNKSGKCTIQISGQMPEGFHEMFLDVIVKAAGYEKYKQERMIRILDISQR